MKHKRLLNIGLVASASLLLIMGVILASALPVIAGPPKQDSGTPIPTPTLYPVSDDELKRTLETVGGDGVMTQTFPGETVEGVTFGETTVETEFPDDLYFYTNVESDSFEIDDVGLLIRYNNGAEIGARPIIWDEETESWRATWHITGKIPAWAEVEFQWVVRDPDKERIFGTWHPLTVVDPAHEWFRVENDYAVLYWYGFGEDKTEQIANEFTQAVASTRPRLIEGFGRDISYKPIIVIYPTPQRVLGWNMEEGWGANCATLGMNVSILDFADIPEDIASCPYFPSSGEFSLDQRLYHIYSSATWGMPALFAGDILQGSHPGTGIGGDSWGMNIGPWFWAYGQDSWFSVPDQYWAYDQRLQQLATMQRIPPLRLISWDDQLGEDGCYAFNADLGASFINWLIYNYGGIETHRQIVELMTPTDDDPRGMDFYDAIEQATGKPFGELENEWRAYLELPPLE